MYFMYFIHLDVILEVLQLPLNGQIKKGVRKDLVEHSTQAPEHQPRTALQNHLNRKKRGGSRKSVEATTPHGLDPACEFYLSEWGKY